jgi:hypothetical protein
MRWIQTNPSLQTMKVKIPPCVNPGTHAALTPLARTARLLRHGQMEEYFSLLFPRPFCVTASFLQLPSLPTSNCILNFLVILTHIRRLPHASPQSHLSQFSAQVLAILLPLIYLPELDDYITSAPVILPLGRASLLVPASIETLSPYPVCRQEYI